MHRAVLLALVLTLVGAAHASAQGGGSLRGRIERGEARERALAAAAGQLGRLERATARDAAVLAGRVAAVQREMTVAEDQARRTAARLDAARNRAGRLEVRLAEVQEKLAALLLARYKSGEPDLVTVVLNSDGFLDLLEAVEFLGRVQRADTRLLAVVRDAHGDARRERRRLTSLAAQRRALVEAARRRRDALTGILDGLRRRREALGRARAARAAALQRTRAGRQHAERALRRLLAARARAAVSLAGPGGPWAIPWAVVQCESGGQNLPPNRGGASGYYQFLPQTWAGLGGSTKHAYQAPKAEQDRLAARLWAGGSGARNWVCAGLAGAVRAGRAAG